MQIGGVSNAELNTLELEFLFLTNFELQVHRDLYEKYRSGLMQWNGDQNNNAMGIGTGLGFQLGSKRLAHLVGGALTYNNGSAQPDTPCDDNVDIDGGEEMMADDSRGSSSWENSNGANTPPPYHSQDGIEGQGKGVDSEDMVMD